MYRYAGNILDYMVLANILEVKGTNFYHLSSNESLIEYHLDNENWFDGYDSYYGKSQIPLSEIRAVEENWIQYVNKFDNIEAFKPQLSSQELVDISKLVTEYYFNLKSPETFSTKMIGDYGESLVLVHEYLRTLERSNRQHIINKMPTPLGVGYDIQSIELEKLKRYIEVKTTRSKKAITSNRFKLTPNEWDSAETLGGRYFIYYLKVNEKGKSLFVIQDPVNEWKKGNLKVNKNLIVEFTEKSGIWKKLLEIS